MKYFTLGFCLVILLASTGAWAEIYQWTDAQGNTHFGDRPPASSSARSITIDINSYESITVEPFEAFVSNRGGGKKTVTMYSTTWCGVCKRARQFFQAQKIPFREYDVEKTEKGRRDYKKLNGRGVPIILVGDKRMNGFSVGRFKGVYGARKK